MERTYQNLKKRCPHRSGTYGQLCMLIHSTYDNCKKSSCPIIKERDEFIRKTIEHNITGCNENTIFPTDQNSEHDNKEI